MPKNQHVYLMLEESCVISEVSSLVNISYKLWKQKSCSLEEAIYFCSEISQVIRAVLNVIDIYLASVAAFERGFSLMNSIMNDFRSLVKLRTHDASVRISGEKID